jgi:hypothetical protein
VYARGNLVILEAMADFLTSIQSVPASAHHLLPPPPLDHYKPFGLLLGRDVCFPQQEAGQFKHSISISTTLPRRNSLKPGKLIRLQKGQHTLPVNKLYFILELLPVPPCVSKRQICEQLRSHSENKSRIEGSSERINLQWASAL